MMLASSETRAYGNSLRGWGEGQFPQLGPSSRLSIDANLVTAAPNAKMKMTITFLADPGRNGPKNNRFHRGSDRPDPPPDAPGGGETKAN